MISVQSAEDLLKKIYKCKEEPQHLDKINQVQEQNFVENVPAHGLKKIEYACQVYTDEQEYLEFIYNILTHRKAGTKILLINAKIESIKAYFKSHYLDLQKLEASKEILFYNITKVDQKNWISALDNFISQNIGNSSSAKFNHFTILLNLQSAALSLNKILEYEFHLTQKVLRNSTLIGQYNLSNYNAKQGHQILQSHPYLILANRIYQNQYYSNSFGSSAHASDSSKFFQYLKNIIQSSTHFPPDIINYKKIFQNQSAAILVHKREGNVLAVNEQVCKMTGYNRSDLLNNNIKQLFYKQEYTKYRKCMQNLEKESEKSFATELLNSDKQKLPVQIQGKLIDNNLIQSRISPKPQAYADQKDFHRSEQRYRQLVETTGDIIIRHNAKGQIDFVNKAGLKFSGYSQAQVLGQSISKFLPEEELVQLKQRKEKRLNGDKRHYHFETNFINRKGERIAVSVNSSPIIKNGEYKGSLFVARDITSQKKIEEDKRELQKQKNKSQKLETLGTLAGGVGHDFNNILTPVLGYAELMKENFTNDDPNSEYINEIIDGCLRAKEIIQQMLSFSRETEQKRYPLDIATIIKETLKLLRPSIPRTIAIERNIKADNTLILADPTRIHQILMNLCTNAYQAMEKNGGSLSITADNVYIDKETSQRYLDLEQGNYIKLTISDTGCGMDEETLEHIFEPFYTTKQEGTGMGLAVVHGIVKDHEGRISVYSEPGAGSSFNIYFPIIKFEDNEKKVAEPEIVKGSGTILLLDDRQDVSTILNQMLTKLGYHVIFVNSSPNAYELYKQHWQKFDLVITDMIMPDMTGLEFACKIREFGKSIPIVLMSGHAYNLSPAELEQNGIAQLLHKPIRFQELSKTIQKLIK